MPEYKKIKWGKKTGKGYEVFVSPTGITHYFLDGRNHREDGPAVIYSDGTKEWCLNGKRHREDGPAVTAAGGAKAWFLNGKKLYKEDFTIEMIRKMNASELFTPQELAKLRLDASS